MDFEHLISKLERDGMRLERWTLWEMKRVAVLCSHELTGPTHRRKDVHVQLTAQGDADYWIARLWEELLADEAARRDAEDEVLERLSNTDINDRVSLELLLRGVTGDALMAAFGSLLARALAEGSVPAAEVLERFGGEICRMMDGNPDAGLILCDDIERTGLGPGDIDPGVAAALGGVMDDIVLPMME